MTLFSLLKSFLVGGVVTSSMVILAYKAIKRAADSYAETNKTVEFATRNITKRFEAYQTDVEFVVLHLLPLLEQELEAISIAPLKAKLKTNPRDNLIWAKLMINSFAKTMVAIYVSTSLTLFSTVQLGILGRKSYIASFEDSSKDGTKDEATFLAFSWFLLHTGAKNITDLVKEACAKGLANKSLLQSVTYDELVKIFDSIRALVHERHIVDFIMASDGLELEMLQQSGVQETVISAKLQTMIDETRDFVQSADFADVLQVSFDAAFQSVFEMIESHYEPHAKLQRGVGRYC